MELIVLRADALFQIHLPGLQFTHYPLCGWIPRRIQVNYLAEGNAVLSPVRVEPVTSGLPAASLRTCKMNQSEMESVRAKESYRKSLREQEKRENVWVRERLWEYVYSRRYTPLCTVHSELRLDSGPINKLVQFCNVSVRTPPYAPTSCVLDRENEKDKMIYLFYFLSRHCHSGKFQMHCVPVIPLSFWTQTNEIVYF